MVLAKDGIFKTRPGTVKVFESTAPIRGLGSYGQSLAIATDNTLYVGGVARGSCDTTYTVGLVEFKDVLCILDGGNLKVYDGVSITTVSIAPKARFGLSRTNRLWLAGDPDNPSTLWYSGVNDYTDWGETGLELGGFFDINPTAGSWISGLALFFDTILIFKDGNEKKIYRLDGTTQENFTVRDVIGGTTCVSHRTTAFSPVGTLFYSDSGVYSFDGSKSVVVPIATKILDQLNFTDNSKVSAVFWADESLYLLAYENYIFAFNVNVGAWYKWEFPYTISAITVVGKNCYIGTEEGKVYRLDWNVYDDDGEAIESSVSTPFYDLGDSSITKYIKYVYMFIFPYGGGTLKVDFDADYATLRGVFTGGAGISPSGSLDFTFEAGAGWDDPNVGWDDPNVGWDGVIAVPLVVKIPISARCRNIQFIVHSDDTPFSLYGVEISGAVLRPA